MEICTVKKSHKASYINPIKVAKGNTLRLTGRTDLWDGHLWVWAVAADNREGWIPNDLMEKKSGNYVASRGFSAIELSCRSNEDLQVLERSHGWAWCKNKAGKFGWVPLENF